MVIKLVNSLKPHYNMYSTFDLHYNLILYTLCTVMMCKCPNETMTQFSYFRTLCLQTHLVNCLTVYLEQCLNITVHYGEYTSFNYHNVHNSSGKVIHFSLCFTYNDQEINLNYCITTRRAISFNTDIWCYLLELDLW